MKTNKPQEKKYSVAWAEQKRIGCKICQKVSYEKRFCKRHTPKVIITKENLYTSDYNFTKCLNCKQDNKPQGNMKKETILKEFDETFSPEWWKGFGTTDDIDNVGISGIKFFISNSLNQYGEQQYQRGYNDCKKKSNRLTEKDISRED
jgi:hypothetical protein